jgi:hypothetical protein
LPAIALVAATAFAPTGSAAGGAVQPALRLAGEPVTVATATTRDGRHIDLVAQDSNQGLCLTLKGLALSAGTECEPPPTTPQFDAFPRSVFDAEPAPTSYYYGVVSARTAAIELRFRGRRPRAYEATDGGYAGRFKGQVHFFLGVLRGEREAIYSRALDAAGRVNSADENEAAVRPYRGPVQIAGGRADDRPWRALAELKNMLAPAPHRPERRLNYLCLVLKRSPPKATGGSRGSSTCSPLALHHGGIGGGFDVRHRHRGCPVPSLYLYGQVRSSAATLALSFADGTRNAVPAVDVRSSLGLRRKLFVLESSSVSDPLELDAFSRSGRRVARVDFSARQGQDVFGCSESIGLFASESAIP